MQVNFWICGNLLVFNYDEWNIKAFSSLKGVQQGDPLSPYLFILMKEVLSKLLKWEFYEGWIRKFFHLRGTPLVSHLLYVDDFLVFANGERTLKRILKTLEMYKNWSGKYINKDKSTLFLSNKITSSRRMGLVLLTDFWEGKFPVTYLGVSLILGWMTSRMLDT